MALTEGQLLMLDTLIYTNYVRNDATVREIVQKIESSGYNVDGAEMSVPEWQELVSMIKNEPELLDYTVTEYVDDGKTGMRAACFVDSTDHPSDVNVVFRGTSGSYEWHDNGEGGYLSDTNQQEAAAEYINQLPEEYGNHMTVTGHSKGGNKAQYVTIVTDRIERCVSYDGQGFSQEFLEKYNDAIAEKSHKIFSISASADIVNCLLYPIAGTRVYLETERQDPVWYYHKPNILLTENGDLRPQTEQFFGCKLITEYTTYMISNLDEPERSITVDGLIALFESGENKESILQTIYAGGTALSHLDDFAFSQIKEKYGLGTELRAAYFAAVCCPVFFLDDLLNCGKEMIYSVVDKMMDFAHEIEKKLREFGQKASQFAQKFVGAITTFAEKVCDWYNKIFNSGYEYASANTYIEVNTALLRAYADRLSRVNRRVLQLDRRMDSLYTKAGLLDLWNLLQADILTGYSWRLNRCINYLNDTAAEFESVERSIISQL